MSMSSNKQKPELILSTINGYLKFSRLQVWMVSRSSSLLSILLTLHRKTELIVDANDADNTNDWHRQHLMASAGGAAT